MDVWLARWVKDRNLDTATVLEPTMKRAAETQRPHSEAVETEAPDGSLSEAELQTVAGGAPNIGTTTTAIIQTGRAAVANSSAAIAGISS